MILSEISFPVFRLKQEEPLREGTVLYYKTESFNQDTAEYSTSIRLIDDTSIDAPTLSRRRLRMKSEGAPLYPIRNAVYFIADLVKYATTRNYWWIDSLGRVFNYKKSTRAKLKFYKLKQIMPLPGMGYIVLVEGLPQRFKCLYRPAPEQRWVGILECGMMRFLYGFYEHEQEPSWRMV